MKMKITEEIIADFRNYLPMFADSTVWSTKEVKKYLEEADDFTSMSWWGDYKVGRRSIRRKGLFYLAAHCLVYAYGSGGTDPKNMTSDARLNVASQSIGDMSVTYRVTSMEPTTEDALSVTNFGVKYRELRDLVACGAMVL